MSNEIEVLKEHYIAHVLRGDFTATLALIKVRASQLDATSNCMISYAWPMTPEEEGVQERVHQMCNDLESAGVHAFMDITKGDQTTNFMECLPQWITQSDTVVLVGSSSYRSRATDPSTATCKEVVEIFNKKRVNPNSIVPVLFEGRFGSSYPPGLQDTIGGRFTKPSEYVRELPGVAAAILGISKDPEVSKLIQEYEKRIKSVEINTTLSNGEEIARVKQNVNTQKKYWQSRVVVLKSQFSLEQLRPVDGNINKNTLLMDAYCSSIISHLQLQTNSTSPSLPNDQLQSFISSPEKRVLLLCAHLQHSLPNLTCLALSTWTKSQTIPVFIDLTSIKESDASEDCIVKSLQAQGLTLQAIEQAKHERSSFLFLVTGFEESNVCTNVYMRAEMYTWPGKVIFTISPDCMQLTTSIPLYFTPCSTESTQIPDDDGLQIVILSSDRNDNLLNDKEKQSPITLSSSAGLTPTQHFLPVMNTAVPPVSASPNIDTESLPWQDAPLLLKEKVVSKYIAQLKATAEQNNKGFLLLQRDIVRVKCHEFISHLPSLLAPSSSKLPHPSIQAFISYTWPQDLSYRVQLQKQLLDLVEDLSHAGITTALDIMQLRPGSDVQQFMKNEIEKSNIVLWIGTPDLKKRMIFDDKGMPTTNAAIEFTHICNKTKIEAVSYAKVLSSQDSLDSFSSLPSSKWSVQALLFRGKELDAFPANHGLPVISHDFTHEANYYAVLPQLVGAILGISNSPKFLQSYNKYCTNVAKWEKSFTLTAIQSRLELNIQEELRIQVQSDARLKELLSHIPAAYIKDQLDADVAQTQALLTALSQMKKDSLSPDTPHSQALEYYVPLQLGTQQDTPPQFQFKALDKLKTFIYSENDSSSMVLLGSAGSGKSLFAHFVERTLWTAWDEKLLSSDMILPIYISLPLLFTHNSSLSSLSTKTKHPFNLPLEAFKMLGFTEEKTLILSQTVRFLFILDGLDEVALDLLPHTDFFHHTQLSGWLQNSCKAVAICRTQHISILENHLDQSLQQYFTFPSTQHTPVIQQPLTYHLMPFNTSQIHQFLEVYVHNTETSQRNIRKWTVEEYKKSIEQTSGLSSLAQNPFLLKMLVRILPQMKTVLPVKRSLIYQEFASQLFHRESWKRMAQGMVLLTRCLPTELHKLSERVAQRLFSSSSISVSLSHLSEESDAKLLSSIPVDISDGQARFIHKSLQEFFVAQAWIRCLDCDDHQQLTDALNSNFVSSEEGVLAFISQLISLSHHSKKLLKVVLESRNSETGILASTASSNAITILNHSRQSFSGMDLSGISIPQADLSFAIMEKTNLARSNLSECKMQQVWLKGANLQECNMTDVKLVEFPWIEFESEVYCMWVEKDMLVLGLEGGDIEVWDPSTMQRIGDPLKGHTYKVTSVAVSNGKIISGSKDKTIRIWSMATRQQIGAPLQGHTGKVHCVAVADGKIISGSEDHTVRIWDLETGQQIGNPLQGHTDQVDRVAISNGKIISGSRDETILIWDMITMKQIGNPLKSFPIWVDIITLWNDEIISGSLDRTIQMWMHQFGDTLKDNSVCCLTASDDMIVCGGYYGVITIWDMKTMQQIGNISVSNTYNNNRVRVVDNQRLLDITILDRKILVAMGNTIRILDMTTMQRIGIGGADHRASFKDPSIKTIPILDYITLYVWQHDNLLQDNSHPWAVISSMGLVPSRGSDFRIWDMTTISALQKVYGSSKSIGEFSIVDGKIIFAGYRTLPQIWDIKTMQQVDEPLPQHKVSTMEESGGKIIYGCYEDNAIRIWDTKTMSQVGEPLRGHTSNVASIVVSDGKIISGSWDCSVRVWDMATMRQIGNSLISEPLRGHTKMVTSVAVSGGWIISGSTDSTIIIWDMNTMQQIGKMHSDTIVAYVAVVHKQIISVCENAIIRTWDITQQTTKSKLKGTMIHCSEQLPLNFRKCDMQGVKGLSAQQELCIKQRGVFMDIKERNKESKVSEELRACIERGECTFSVTGQEYHEQLWWTCATCKPNEPNEGCCASCAAVCHKGHELVERKFSGFFCDCGAGWQCKLMDKNK